jgi:hypothetical protein
MTSELGLARPPHGAEPIRHRVLKPDQALAPLVGLGLDGHAAKQKRGADRLERLDADREADQCRFPREPMDTTFAAVSVSLSRKT